MQTVIIFAKEHPDIDVYHQIDLIHQSGGIFEENIVALYGKSGQVVRVKVNPDADWGSVYESLNSAAGKLY